MAEAPSSPMAFPSSSSSVAGGPAGGAENRASSPMAFPPSSSSAGAANAGNGGLFRQMPPSSDGVARLRSTGTRDDSPLFFPPTTADPDDSASSVGSPTPRRSANRRGDIHSNAPPTPSGRSVASGAGGNLGSDGGIRMPSSSAAGGGPSSSAANDSEAEEEEDGPRPVIWGTTVSLDLSMASFRRFLEEFRAQDRQTYDQKRYDEAESADERAEIVFGHSKKAAHEKVYESYLQKMWETGQTNLNLDMTDLLAFRHDRTDKKKDRDFHQLHRNLILYPQEIIPVLDQVLKDAVIDYAYAHLGPASQRAENTARAEELDGLVFKVRPFGVEHTTNMRDLNPQDIDKVVSVKGLVIRASPIIPDMKVGFFRCLVCSHTMSVEIDRGKIAEPDRCPREVCGQPDSMSLIHNRCEFADRQIVRLQETPDAVPDGQTPHTVSLCLYDELVDTVKPGDRILLTGIFRSTPVRLNPRMRVIKSLFKTYVDVVHVKKTDAKRLGIDSSTRSADERRGAIGVGGEDESAAPSAMDVDGGDLEDDEETSAETRLKEKLVEMSRRPDIYDHLARALAPSIWEMDDVKKGILLQLFGGTNKSIARGGGGGGPRYRGDINVLLVGDPGTSKSQILKYVHRIAPRGVYTSGKGSSAVGLTAYVTRDPDSKQLVLESGALVLSDGGVCCIDEFDKMSDATRSVLHEVMEQQTVSVAKAGIITTLNARTSILAAANPVGSKYNLDWPITRNIDLPPTLISRFDLLYLVLDKIDEANDRRLAKHLVGLYLEDRPETGGGNDIMKIEDLSAYISWARNHIHPTLTQGASDALVAAYVDMRSGGAEARSNDRRITATTRQLESMIRLSEAHARMRYSTTVEVEDVQEANRLIREALKESATDPLTGLIDLDLLQGQSTHQRKLRGDLRREVLNLLESRDRGIRWTELVKALEAQSSLPIDNAELSEIIRSLEQDGNVKVHGERDRRTIRKVAGGPIDV